MRFEYRKGLASALLLPIWALLIGGSCGDAAQDAGGTTPGARELPAPDLRLVILTDLMGYLEPCGCTSRPLGGIDRMAARVRALRAEVPATLVLAAGDLFFQGGGHDGVESEVAETQALWEAQTLVEVLNRLGLDAATPGPLDFGHGTDTFVGLSGRAQFRLLGAGLERMAELRERVAPSVMREVGNLKVGIVGVGDFGDRARGVPEGIAYSAPVEAAREAVAALRGRGAQVLIVMVYGTRRTARMVADGVDGLHFVVQAGLDEEEALPPASENGAHILHAGRQGQGLVAVDVFRPQLGPLTDLSAWSRSAERTRLDGRMEELRRRIAGWEADDSVAAADLRVQRRRLRSMGLKRAELDQPLPLRGSGFDARYLELSPESPRMDSITNLLKRHDRRVNEHNREAFRDATPAPTEDGEPHYVGSLECASCHAAANRWWEGHPHGRAYETLVTRHKQFNLSCVGCHVTGYMRPGGSTITHNLDGKLVNVGCESCHGPGSEHLTQPEEVHLVAEPPESGCVTCHSPEHSDRFEYSTYRTMLLAPGHGLPEPPDDAQSTEGAPTKGVE